MLYIVTEYLKFLTKSTNQHGIHSPFIFDLATKCFYDKRFYEDYEVIKNYANKLLNNKSIITVKDFGAGSRIFKNEQRKVSKIAKHVGITQKKVKLLYRIAKYTNATTVLELGTSLGMATSALSVALPKGLITTIEGCPETACIAKKQFKNYSFHNITLKVNNFDEELQLLGNQTYDLIYVDGNHQKDSTLKYFDSLLHNVHNNSIIIFDDIHWSKGMTEAWETIKQHPKVTVSIDTFFWGFIFFRKEQAKEHFIIRV